MADYETLPIGRLSLAAGTGCEEFSKKVDNYLISWRKERAEESLYDDYNRDTYLVGVRQPRFSSGEAKCELLESVRGDDLYIMVDVCNYSVTYSAFGGTNHMSPDDHYQNLKRIIDAAAGKARKITVIMPFLYESRQHRKTGRESMDCAYALQELQSIGVDRIITFDAHDPRVQNAIPLRSFDNVHPNYQFIKALFKAVPDVKADSGHLMIISPDEGAMGRAIYLANVLGVDIGMFYKRRDYSQVVNGSNPIIDHQFLGSDVEGKDVIIVDDMIASGSSIVDVAKELKRRKAARVFSCATFGLFTSGMGIFDECYEKGIIDKIFTTNLIYQSPETLKRPYYVSVDMSKYVALIIDTLNHDASMQDLLDPYDRINKILEKHRREQESL